MKVLLLGSYHQGIVDVLSNCGDNCINTEEKLGSDTQLIKNIDFIISYGHRFILKEDLLSKFHKKIINIHISLLPWNRGSDPNLWSFLEDTPKGVTIHYMDSGIDTGDILVQRETEFSQEETLRSTYIKLSEVAVDLFRENWIDIRENNLNSVPQFGKSSYHSLKDKIQYEYLLKQGWDTSVAQLQGKAINS